MRFRFELIVAAIALITHALLLAVIVAVFGWDAYNTYVEFAVGAVAAASGLVFGRRISRRFSPRQSASNGPYSRDW